MWSAGGSAPHVPPEEAPRRRALLLPENDRGGSRVTRARRRSAHLTRVLTAGRSNSHVSRKPAPARGAPDRRPLCDSTPDRGDPYLRKVLRR